jgi:NitT/TauT family transport system substrate-binding protein
MPTQPAAVAHEPVYRTRIVLARALAAAASTAAVLALAACGSSAASSTGTAHIEKPDLTVSVVPATSVAGLYIAQERGYFAAAGLHVKIVPVVSGVNALPELVRGSVDIDEGQWTSDVAAQASGAAHLRVLAPGNSGGTALEEVVTPPGSAIQTVQQLRGKTIAVNALKGLAVLLTSNVLNSYGVDPSSVHFVVVPFPAMGAALAAHRVDAAFMPEPFLSAAGEAKGVVPLFDIDQGAAHDFPIAGYVTTQAWAARYPNTRGAFAAALARGQKVAATSRPAVDQAMTGNLHGVSKVTASTMALGTYPLTMTGNDLVRVATLMKLNKLLPQTVNATALAKEMITGGR